MFIHIQTLLLNYSNQINDQIDNLQCLKVRLFE